MSIEVMAEVWKKSQHSGTNLLMLLSVADFADDDGVAFPSVQRLAVKCRMSKRNAQDRLRELAESGELSIFKNQGPPPKFPNLFQVNLGALGVKPTAADSANQSGTGPRAIWPIRTPAGTTDGASLSSPHLPAG